MDDRHGHVSSFIHQRPTKNVSSAVGPKNAVSTRIEPIGPPAQSPIGTIIIMLGPGANCPTLYKWINCGKVSHLCTSTVRVFISGNAAIPPPTVSRDRYANTRKSAESSLIVPPPLSPRCEADARKLP